MEKDEFDSLHEPAVQLVAKLKKKKPQNQHTKQKNPHNPEPSNSNPPPQSL